MTSYLPYCPRQQMPLPQALQEWLPEGHVAYFISDAVDGLNLGVFHARCDGGGPRNQPFHSAMMVKVLLCGYATGVFSSGKIARKLHEDLAFRVLASGNLPSHRTLSDFRAFHLKVLSELFVQVVRLAREMGLVKLGALAVDGAKVKANACRHKAMSYGHMVKAEAELKRQIEAGLAAIAEARLRLEQRQREADQARDRSDDDDRRPRGGDGKPKGGRYKRDFGVPEDQAQKNFADPDSRIMKRAGGSFDLSYNAQTAVDEPAHIIVVAELTNNASDAGQLAGVLQAVRDNIEQRPRSCWPMRATVQNRPSRTWTTAALS